MKNETSLKPRRGRPAKEPKLLQTRELLLRAGLEVLTEKGFSSAGIDEILKQVGVPKGSFYHYFKSKEAFGAELIDCYAAFFSQRLNRHLNNSTLTPLGRLRAFVDDAKTGMAKYHYRRGCLAGKLGQEISVLPESFRSRLIAVFADWQNLFAQGLLAAKQAGEISEQTDCQKMAAWFWIGWEGAVLRSSLEQSPDALDLFSQAFFEHLIKK